jgi:hypothetical protein
MDVSKEEFCAFVIALYAECRARGPAKSLTMLALLDKLDGQYKRINNLGQWVKREDPQVLTLNSDTFYITVSIFFFERSMQFSPSPCGQNFFTVWTSYSFSHHYETTETSAKAIW